METTAFELYQRRATEGYGLLYPDGHVIRAYEHFLKDKFSQSEEKNILDFGCWNGCHLAYFLSKGFVPHGVDIINDPIEGAKILMPEYKDNFKLITDNSSLLDSFPEESFDLIFCNQSLYFLDDNTFLKRISEFRKLLTSDGYLFATMMARENYFASRSVQKLPNGLEKIVHPSDDRLSGSAEIRFIDSEGHLRSLFKDFNCERLGYYDMSLDVTVNKLHYIFIGRKK